MNNYDGITFFLNQILTEAHGGKLTDKNKEIYLDSMFNQFYNYLTHYFENSLNESQKENIDKMIEGKAGSDSIINYLLLCIENPDVKIIEALESFRSEYLQSN